MPPSPIFSSSVYCPSCDASRTCWRRPKIDARGDGRDRHRAQAEERRPGRVHGLPGRAFPGRRATTRSPRPRRRSPRRPSSSVRRGELGTTIDRRTRPATPQQRARVRRAGELAGKPRTRGGVEQRDEHGRPRVERESRASGGGPRRQAHHSAAGHGRGGQDQDGAEVATGGVQRSGEDREGHVARATRKATRGGRRPGPRNASRSCRNARASLPLDGALNATRAFGSFSAGRMRPQYTEERGCAGF